MHAMKSYGGAERIDACEWQLHILDILQQAKSTRYLLIRRLGTLQSQSEGFGEEQTTSLRNTPLLYSSYIIFSYALSFSNICNLFCVHFACRLLFSIKHNFIPHLMDSDYSE